MENTYITKDFYIASILLASGQLHLIRLDKYTNKIMSFVFKDPNNKAEVIIKNHWDRKNEVKSLDLIEAINQLKTRIYNGI